MLALSALLFAGADSVVIHVPTHTTPHELGRCASYVDCKPERPQRGTLRSIQHFHYALRMPSRLCLLLKAERKTASMDSKLDVVFFVKVGIVLQWEFVFQSSHEKPKTSRDRDNKCQEEFGGEKEEDTIRDRLRIVMLIRCPTNKQEHPEQTYSDAAAVVVDVAHSAANAAAVPSSDSAIVPAIALPPLPQPLPSLLALPLPLPVPPSPSAETILSVFEVLPSSPILFPLFRVWRLARLLPLWLCDGGLVVSVHRLEDGCAMLDPYLPIVSPTLPRGFLCRPPMPTPDLDIPFSDLLCRVFSAPPSSAVTRDNSLSAAFLGRRFHTCFFYYVEAVVQCEGKVEESGSVVVVSVAGCGGGVGVWDLSGAWSWAMSWSSKSMIAIDRLEKGTQDEFGKGSCDDQMGSCDKCGETSMDLSQDIYIALLEPTFLYSNREQQCAILDQDHKERRTWMHAVTPKSHSLPPLI
ncbi:hypothetical protein KCU84_g9, partial [Aureobasidium melanogenum]